MPLYNVCETVYFILALIDVVTFLPTLGSFTLLTLFKGMGPSNSGNIGLGTYSVEEETIVLSGASFSYNQYLH